MPGLRAHRDTGAALGAHRRHLGSSRRRCAGARHRCLYPRASAHRRHSYRRPRRSARAFLDRSASRQVLTGARKSPMRITLAARMAKAVFLFWLILASVPSWPASPDLDFRAPQAAGDAAMGAVMRDLAERLLPVYQEPDPDRYLAVLSALQMVAGDYGAARRS